MASCLSVLHGVPTHRQRVRGTRGQCASGGGSAANVELPCREFSGDSIRGSDLVKPEVSRLSSMSPQSCAVYDGESGRRSAHDPHDKRLRGSSSRYSSHPALPLPDLRTGTDRRSGSRTQSESLWHRRCGTSPPSSCPASPRPRSPVRDHVRGSHVGVTSQSTRGSLPRPDAPVEDAGMPNCQQDSSREHGQSSC